jgi:hypothetical protein
MNKAEQFLLDRINLMVSTLLTLSNDPNVISIKLTDSETIKVGFCIYKRGWDNELKISFRSLESFEENMDEYREYVYYYIEFNDSESKRTNALNKLTAGERELLGL